MILLHHRMLKRFMCVPFPFIPPGCSLSASGMVPVVIDFVLIYFVWMVQRLILYAMLLFCLPFFLPLDRICDLCGTVLICQQQQCSPNSRAARRHISSRIIQSRSSSRLASRHPAVDPSLYGISMMPFEKLMVA